MTDQLTAFAYAAGRDPAFPIVEGIEELRRLGASWLPRAESQGPLVEWIAAIRAGADDGRQFQPDRWRQVVELVRMAGLSVRIDVHLPADENGPFGTPEETMSETKAFAAPCGWTCQADQDHHPAVVEAMRTLERAGLKAAICYADQLSNEWSAEFCHPLLAEDEFDVQTAQGMAAKAGCLLMHIAKAQPVEDGR